MHRFLCVLPTPCGRVFAAGYTYEEEDTCIAFLCFRPTPCGRVFAAGYTCEQGAGGASLFLAK